MGNVTYDWSPFFQAIQGATQRSAYNRALDGMFGGGLPQQSPQAAPPMGTDPGMSQGTQIPGQVPQPPSPIPNAPNGQMGGRMAQLMPLLKMLPPEQGMPLLLQMTTKQNEYDPTPRIGTNPNTGQLDQYVVSKDGSGIHWLGVKPREKMEVSDGKAYNPYEVHPGDVVGSPKEPKAPQSRTIQRGTQNVTQQFNPASLQWEDVPGAVGPKFKPDTIKPPNPNAPITILHPSAGY